MRIILKNRYMNLTLYDFNQINETLKILQTLFIA